MNYHTQSKNYKDGNLKQTTVNKVITYQQIFVLEILNEKWCLNFNRKCKLIYVFRIVKYRQLLKPHLRPFTDTTFP